MDDSILIIMPIKLQLFCFLFQQDELLASQHYDDNSVACIEDKCSVLGMRQYCRYNFNTLYHCQSSIAIILIILILYVLTMHIYI